MSCLAITPARIAALVNAPSPKNVAANWPLVESCLNALGIWSEATAVAAIATIAVETGGFFRPLHEFGSEEYLRAKPYYPFVGRGLIQLTWKLNYQLYGDMIGVDLIARPDAALEPNTSALLFAVFFREHRVHVAADAGQWRKVRRLVNGGTNGLKPFLQYVRALLGELNRSTDYVDSLLAEMAPAQATHA